MKATATRIMPSLGLLSKRPCKFNLFGKMTASTDRYHVPYDLSMSQRMFLVPYYGLGAIINPERGDLVAGLGDVTGERQLRSLRLRLEKTAAGRKLLKDKPLITEASLNFSSLQDLPANSLGNLYGKYMTTHSFCADERAVVKFISCPETAYVMARYRQIHDFWHVLCDLPPTLLGEIALKWYEWKLTGLPVCGFSSVLGPLKLTSVEMRLLWRVYIPWVQRSRSCCEDLLSFRYEENLHRPVEEIRKELRIEQAPPP